MEAHSYETFIDSLIEQFEMSDFSPENAIDIPKIINSKIVIDTPYWKPVKMENGKKDIFYMEFKKYGEKRKCIYLKISFNCNPPRELVLSLIHVDGDEFKDVDEIHAIPLSDIWKDHSVLSSHLKKYVKQGLNLASQLINNEG